MKRVILFFFAVVFVAGLTAFGTVRLSSHDRTLHHLTAHDWLHRELALTADQERALEPVEARFVDKQRAHSAALREAHRALGRAIAEEKRYTPRVAAAIEAVHERIGDLQKTSIEHVFEMQTLLSPEQGEKLLAVAQKALEQHHKPPSH